MVSRIWNADDVIFWNKDKNDTWLLMTSHAAVPYYSLEGLKLKGHAVAGSGEAGEDWTLRSGLTFLFICFQRSLLLLFC